MHGQQGILPLQPACVLAIGLTWRGAVTRGRGGGRGGGGGPYAAAAAKGAAPFAEEVEGVKLPFTSKVAQRLFSADAELATDEPMCARASWSLSCALPSLAL